MPDLELIHLSGARRGQTDAIHSLPARLGSGPDADVQVPGAAELHALIAEERGRVYLRDLDSGRGTFLADESVSETPLRDGDAFELGRGGPRLRFRRLGERHVPLLRALGWRRPEGAPDRLADASGLLRAAWIEAGRRVSRTTRRLALIGFALILAALGWSYQQSRRTQAELSRLSDALRSAEEERARFQVRVEEERRRAEAGQRALLGRIEESRRREEELSRRLQEAAAGEVRVVREELFATRGRLQALESERAAAERIIAAYGGGVCLIQGSYAYYDAQARPLRRPEAGAAQAKEDDGSLSLSVDGQGSVHTVDYFGTGFLVQRKGLVLTNRHVAEPWWKSATAEALRGAGYKPRFVLFRAFFPRQREPFELEVRRVSEHADLALVSLAPHGRRIPVLPLDLTGRGAVPGHAVTVVGYPTGLEAILAKADSQVVSEILDRAGTDSQRVTEELSARGLIRPSTTQGHIGDITATDVVFDAPSTLGGSGAPVFNRAGQVVAIEYAVLTGFGGNSFGIPMRFAAELLRPPKPRQSGD